MLKISKWRDNGSMTYNALRTSVTYLTTPNSNLRCASILPIRGHKYIVTVRRFTKSGLDFKILLQANTSYLSTFGNIKRRILKFLR
jgi:hypothetical protein